MRTCSGCAAPTGRVYAFKTTILAGSGRLRSGPIRPISGDYPVPRIGDPDLHWLWRHRLEPWACFGDADLRSRVFAAMETYGRAFRRDNPPHMACGHLLPQGRRVRPSPNRVAIPRADQTRRWTRVRSCRQAWRRTVGRWRAPSTPLPIALSSRDGRPRLGISIGRAGARSRTAPEARRARARRGVGHAYAQNSRTNTRKPPSSTSCRAASLCPFFAFLLAPIRHTTCCIHVRGRYYRGPHRLSRRECRSLSYVPHRN